MSFKRINTPIFFTDRFSEILIEHAFLYKDLDFFYSLSLSFEHHIINITISKTLKTLGFIKPILIMFISLSCLCSLYSALVHSTLEYGVVVWQPYLVKDQLRYEQVQNKFLSYAAYLLKIDHPKSDYSHINPFVQPSRL